MKKQNLIAAICKLFSYIPFFKLVLRFFYLKALNILKNKYLNDHDIRDILLTSQTNSKSFTYGQSDYNILVIVSNDCHPKKVLSDIRQFIKKNFLLNLVINSIYIPILTEDEYRTDTIKSYLIRKTNKEKLSWFSIFDEKENVFLLRKQDRFALIHNAIQTLDFFLLKEHIYKINRNSFKNISHATKILNKFFPESFKSSKKLIKTSTILQKYFFLSPLYKQRFYRLTWECFTKEVIKVKSIPTPVDIPLEHKLKSYLIELCSLPILDDITVTPTIIQFNKEELTGKLFIDLHINDNVLHKDYSQRLDNLVKDIKKYESKSTKLRIRFTTNSLYRLQNEKAYYPFPLEGLFRKNQTYSIQNYDYSFINDFDSIISSSIHFLTGQFMRFRSLEQKTDLIGSKFIKSINLMYKYYLLSEFLKGKEFKQTSNEKKIREVLTPQFSNIAHNDTVTEEHWVLIKAQLQYFLKDIREELCKYDPSLKVLRF